MATVFSFLPAFVGVTGSLLALSASGQGALSVVSQAKLSSTTGGLIGPLHDDDLFGLATARLGDLDGDGIGDVAVGAQYDDDGGFNRGAIWVLFLNADGTVKDEQKISDTAGGFTGILANNNGFGGSLGALGDLDGDGVVDLVAGAGLDDEGGSDQGAVWILFLNADGTVKAHQKINGVHGGFGGVLASGGFFGASPRCAGDLDGDSVLDIAVGAPGTASLSGAVWILFLNPDGTVKDEQAISSTSGGFTGSLDALDYFGRSASPAGDLVGDSVVDLFVGARGDDDGGVDRGAVGVLLLNADGTVKAHQKISATAGAFTGLLFNGDMFSNYSGLDLLPDLDGDGVPELAVGATGNDGGGPNRGGCWILFMNPNGTVKGHLEIDDTTPLCGGALGLMNGDEFGAAVSSLGDFNGDGLQDLIVGAFLDDDGGTDRGAVHLLSIGPDTIPPEITCPPAISLIDRKWNGPGEVVLFSVTASDNCDPAPSVVCVPPSGSLFGPGTTLVTCTATDAAGNQSMCAFPVVVMPLQVKKKL